MKSNYFNLIPVVIFISFFFLYALYYSFMQSIGLNPIVGDPSFTLNYYKKMFNDSDFFYSLIYTFKIVFTSSFLSLFIAIIILFFMYINIESNKIIYIFNIIRFPILVPYIVASYMIFLLFMDNGVLDNFFLTVFNIKIDFSRFINDKNGIGIIITYIWKTSPFFIMMSFPILHRIQKTWTDLAYIFNISRCKFFVLIVMPLLAPSLLTSFFIVVAYTFASFEVPYILGISNPQTFSVYAYSIYSQGDIADRPYLMTINIVLSLISVAIGLIIYFFYKRVKNNIRGWK